MINPLLAARVFDVPLMIEPTKAHRIMQFLGPRLIGQDIQVHGVSQAGVLGDRINKQAQREGRSIYDVIDGVAIIPVEGTLIHKGAWLGTYSGEVSYQGLQAQIRHAMDNGAVRGVAFEVDSPGGEVSGVFETANMIRQLSNKKPTVAILSDMAASAGYMLASATRQISIPRDGRIGSIGALCVHIDQSEAIKDLGLNVTIVHSGSHKIDGNSLGALPDDVRIKMQANLDLIRDRFAAFVGEVREGRISKQDALETEAEVYDGEDGVRLGLADIVAEPSDAFAAFVAAIKRT